MGQKLFSKSEKVHRCGYREAPFLEKLASVAIDESLLTVPWFWRIGKCYSDSAQHHEKPTEGCRFSAVNNAQIAFQESPNGCFIQVTQVEWPIAEPFAESGDRVHLHRRGGRQETLLLNMF
jgi:hypothetical protein